MQNLIYSLNAALPVFFIMLIGWGLRRQGLLTKEFGQVADRFVFKVLLPLLLFGQVRNIDVHQNLYPSYIGFCMAVTLVSVLSVWALARRFVPEQKSVGAFTQSCYRSSAAILGLAFLNNLYGDGAVGGLMLLGSVPLYNVFAVLILTLENPAAKKEPLSRQLGRAVAGVATNPIILGILAGLAASFLRLQLPVMVDKTISSLASITTPLALIAIGVGFEPAAALAQKKLAGIAAAVKLVVLPAVFLPLAALLGIRGPMFMGLIIMLGSPATPTCYAMAKNLGGDEVLASSTILITTMFSAITLTAWIFIWKSLGVV